MSLFSWLNFEHIELSDLLSWCGSHGPSLPSSPTPKRTCSPAGRTQNKTAPATSSHSQGVGGGWWACSPQAVFSWLRGLGTRMGLLLPKVETLWRVWVLWSFSSDWRSLCHLCHHLWWPNAACFFPFIIHNHHFPSKPHTLLTPAPRLPPGRPQMTQREREDRKAMTTWRKESALSWDDPSRVLPFMLGLLTSSVSPEAVTLRLLIAIPHLGLEPSNRVELNWWSYPEPALGLRTSGIWWIFRSLATTSNVRKHEIFFFLNLELLPGSLFCSQSCSLKEDFFFSPAEEIKV